MHFIVNSVAVAVDVVRTTNKHMYLRLIANRIVLSVPWHTSLKDAHDFVNTHITKMVEAQKKQQQLEHNFSLAQSTVCIFGEQVAFTVLAGSRRDTFTFIDNKLVLHCVNNDDTHIKMSLDLFCRERLATFLKREVVYWEKQMGTVNHQIRVSRKKGAWATNSLTKRTIAFATRLVSFKPSTIIYVVIHELAHDFYPHHAPAFWELVRHYMPDFSEHRRILRGS